MRNFIFHLILMGFFAFDSSECELSEVCRQIFSISYRFQTKRGQSSGGVGGVVQLGIMENFIFDLMLMGFFPNDSS